MKKNANVSLLHNHLKRMDKWLVRINEEAPYERRDILSSAGPPCRRNCTLSYIILVSNEAVMQHVELFCNHHNDDPRPADDLLAS